MARALITGILGQDGTYLSSMLAERGFEVHGIVAPDTPPPADSPYALHVADLADPASLAELVSRIAPRRLFNLAGISSVAHSWAEPVATMAINATAAMALLEAAWQVQESSGEQVRFVQASSAEMFGQAASSPQNEATPIRPVNPYGVSKAAAHLAVGVYRARGLHASSLILYNHESPLRPTQFVTQKIAATVAAIARGEASELRLGNLDARRDWGWAPDYARAMVLAAELAEASDYVIATGESRTVRDFVAAAFRHVDIADWERFVVVDPAFLRPVDPVELRGDAGHARAALGWTPTMGFDELVAAMVEDNRR